MIAHSIQYFIVRAGNGVFAIATLAVFTRMLSPAEYGVYALGMSIATAASAIMFQWLSIATGRFFPMYLDDLGKLMGVVSRGFWVAVAATALLFLVALSFHQSLGVAPLMLGILFLITAAIGYHTLALQIENSKSTPFGYGVLSWAKNGFGLIVGIILMQFGAGEHGALLGALAGLLFAAVAIAREPATRIQLGRIDTPLCTDLLRYALPIALHSTAIVIVDVADRLIIGSLLGASHVAPYAAAYDLVQLLIGPLMNIFFLAAYPGVIKVFNAQDIKSTLRHLHALGSKLIVLGLPAAVGIGLLSSEMSAVVVGGDYRSDVETVVPWLAAAIFLAAFKSYYLDIAFQLRKSTKCQTYISVVMLAINIVLNLLLLPNYGVIAAAWATLAAFTVGAILSWLIGRSIFLLPDLGNVFSGSACATAAMALFLFILPASTGPVCLIAKVVAACVIYALMAWMLDIAGCRELLSKRRHC